EEAEQAAHEEAAASRVLHPQIAYRVGGEHDEEHAHQAEDDESQRIGREPAVELGAGRPEPQRDHQHEVEGGRAQQPAHPLARAPPRRRHQRADERNQDQGDEPHQSFSSVRWVELSESNSRLMWNTTIPMMNTPTNTSSR